MTSARTCVEKAASISTVVASRPRSARGTDVRRRFPVNVFTASSPRIDEGPPPHFVVALDYPSQCVRSADARRTRYILGVTPWHERRGGASLCRRPCAASHGTL